MSVMIKKEVLYSKRGVSAVVATALLVFLTVAAAALLAGFAIPFVRESLDRAGECVDYDRYFQFEERIEFQGYTYRYNCFNQTENLQGIAVKTVGENSEKVAGFRIALENSGGISEVFDVKLGEEYGCGDGEVSVLNENERVCEGDIEIPRRGEVKVYVYETTTKYDRAVIHTLTESGSMCDEAGRIDIRSCSIEDLAAYGFE